MNRIFFAIILIFALFLGTVRAESISTANIENEKRTGIKFNDKASIYISTDVICAVSLQSYILGGFEVAEVVIDILGSPSQVRIYAVNENIVSSKVDLAKNKNLAAAANKPKSLVESAENFARAQNPLDINTVIKEYPKTTHSKTLEFRVDFDSLKEFYNAFAADFTCKKPKIGGKLYIFPKQ